MKLKLSTLLLLQAGLVSPYVLAANAKPSDDKSIERITVVGTNIKRAAKSDINPVAVFDKTDIASTGASSVSEVLQSLLPRASIELGTDGGRFAPGANSVALRHLGAQNTLILLNGRRYANNAFANLDQSVVSLNGIPVSALESIEILYDGAAAIYGSDAVAGVINFRTKKNYQGTAITSQYSQWQAGDGERLNLGAAHGIGDLKQDGYNLLFTLDALDRQPAYWKNHQTLRNLDQRELGGSDNRFTGMTAGEYKIAGQTRKAPLDCQGSIAPSPTNPKDQLCLSAQNNYQDAHTKRANLNALLTWRFNDDLEGFAETSGGVDKLHFQSWPISIPTANAVIKPTDKVYKTSLQGVDTNGRNITVYRRLFEAGLAQNHVDSTSWRSVVGLRGQVGAWDHETSALYQLNRSQQLRDRLNTTALANAFKTGSFDPFVVNTADQAQALITQNQFDGNTSLAVAESKVSRGGLWDLAGGDVATSLGVSVQRETAFEARNNGTPTTNASRVISSVFGELSLPLIEDLDSQVAVRYDRYNDFGGSVNPKFAASYQLVPGLLVRGSANTTYRAPSLQQLHMTPTGSYWFYNDWARCKPMGLTAATCTGRVDNNNTSNKDLQPETSVNQTLGFIWDVSTDVRLSVDWYRIRQTDTISRLDTQYILDNEATNPALAALVHRNPLDPDEAARFPGLKVGTIKDVDAPLANIARLETSGVDIELDASWFIGAYGEISLNNKLSYLLSYRQADLPDAVATSRLGGTDHQDWFNRAQLSWKWQPLTVSLIANTTPSSRDIADITQLDTNPDAYLGSYTTIDSHASIEVNEQLTFGAGIKNLLDKVGPYSTNDGGFAGPKYGRQGYVQASYKF